MTNDGKDADARESVTTNASRSTGDELVASSVSDSQPATESLEEGLQIPLGLVLSYRMRHILAIIFFTVCQYGIVAPSAEYVMLTFFARTYNKDVNCELAPASPACRRAAVDAAKYLGGSKALSSVFAFGLAVQLGSISDAVGRRPIFRTKALLSFLPALALTLHVFEGWNLWFYLILMPVYEAFDVTPVFMASMADMVTSSHQRTAAFGVLGCWFLIFMGFTMAPLGILDTREAVGGSLMFCVAKIIYEYTLFPECSRFVDSLPSEGVDPMKAINGSFMLLRRSGRIVTMLITTTSISVALAGLIIVVSPYLTAFLGMTKADASRMVFAIGGSILVSLVVVLPSLLYALKEVRSLQLVLCASVLYPFCLVSCDDVESAIIVNVIFIGPMMLQFPIAAGIKSTLVPGHEQGLLHGGMASVRVLAVSVAYIAWAFYYDHTTHHGTSEDRGTAFPPILATGVFSCAAVATACTMPSRMAKTPEDEDEERVAIRSTAGEGLAAYV
eukprot:TRINITY_DN21214_c0_g1_i1.p1 TRINITY_DN21214_c0_g1~~TRINITY_DN21214_c0_g1_i1.p1  ORF type:complete len:502 (-),score=83.88 TRINITY_DN21214_c0_g1_i1:77-1582(-)